MRFSSIFQQASQPQEVRREAAVQDDAEPHAVQAAPAPDLPDDLDARVRMVGEWQLLEG
jgi:hypothetical protein